MKKRSQIISLIGIILILISGIPVTRALNFQNTNAKAVSQKAPASQKISKTFKTAAFNQVKLDTDRSSLKFIVGEDFHVTVSGKLKSRITDTKVTVDNNQLTIYDKPVKHHNYGGYLVTVTVPDRNTIQKISGTCNLSDLSFNDLAIPYIDLKAQYGDVVMNHVDSKNVHLNQKYGDLKINNSLVENGTVSLDVGDVIITNSQFMINAALGKKGNCKYGDVKISNSVMTGDSSFSLINGDFSMTNAHKMSYKLSTKLKRKIKVNNRSYSKHYSKILKNKPLLKVTNKNGYIKIDWIQKAMNIIQKQHCNRIYRLV